MKINIKLQDLLQQNEVAIAATSTFIGQGLATLDCTNIDSLTPEQITALFSNIPPDWDFIKISEILNPQNLSESLREQLINFINQRLGKTANSQLPTPDSQCKTPNSSKSLDIFQLRNEVIDDYRQYIESFLKIRDIRVREFVNQELDKGQLWPNPLIQLNPAYQSGAEITALINEGILHPKCDRYFSRFRFFYQHQEQAFRRSE